MENLNDESLHENPFDIVDEDIFAASPKFNIIEEDDVDDDLDISSIVVYIDCCKVNILEKKVVQKCNRRPSPSFKRPPRIDQTPSKKLKNLINASGV